MELKLYPKQSYWRCVKCDSKAGIRRDSWFAHSQVLLVTYVQFLHAWAHQRTSIQYCKEELGISRCTTIHLNQAVRDVCVQDLQNKPSAPIGGPGEIVEIDESLFSKRKNNKGRVLPET